MVRIEVLGMGCPNCRRLLAHVQQAIKELGISAEIVKVEDITEITNRGILFTPALYMDGVAKSVGRVPPVEEIKRMLGG